MGIMIIGMMYRFELSGTSSDRLLRIMILLIVDLRVDMRVCYWLGRGMYGKELLLLVCWRDSCSWLVEIEVVLDEFGDEWGLSGWLMVCGCGDFLHDDMVLTAFLLLFRSVSAQLE